MKERVLRFAIAIGEEWFTGFRMPAWQTIAADIVQKSRSTVRLMLEDELRLAVQDMQKCGVTGEIYEIELTRTRRIRFDHFPVERGDGVGKKNSEI